MIFQLIVYVIIANGLFDILSATSILKLTDIPLLNELRLSMFSTKQTPAFERVLAYYVFVNGLVRVFGGMNLYQMTAAKIVAGSYFAEALFVYNESYNHGSIIKSKGQMTIGVSLVLGALSLYNLFF
jgi:Erg28 like protein